MDATACISNEQWELYASGGLQEQDLRHVDMHVQSCEVCADMKEGIDLMSQRTTLSNRMQRLNKKVDAYIQPAPKKLPLFWYWSAAAVLVLGIAGTAIYMQQNKPSTSELSMIDTISHQVPAQAEVKTITIDSPLVALIAPVSPPKQIYTKPEFSSAETPRASLNETVSSQNFNIAQNAHDSGAVYTDDIKNLAKLESEAEEKKEVSMKDNESITMTSKTLAKRSIESLPSPMNNASNALNNNNTFSNNTRVNEGYIDKQYIDSLSKNDSLCMVSVLKQYDSAQYDSCLILLKPLLQRPEGSYYKEAIDLDKTIRAKMSIIKRFNKLSTKKAKK